MRANSCCFLIIDTGKMKNYSSNCMNSSSSCSYVIDMCILLVLLHMHITDYTTHSPQPPNSKLKLNVKFRMRAWFLVIHDLIIAALLRVNRAKSHTYYDLDLMSFIIHMNDLLKKKKQHRNIFVCVGDKHTHSRTNSFWWMTTGHTGLCDSWFGWRVTDTPPTIYRSKFFASVPHRIWPSRLSERFLILNNVVRASACVSIALWYQSLPTTCSTLPFAMQFCWAHTNIPGMRSWPGAKGAYVNGTNVCIYCTIYTYI